MKYEQFVNKKRLNKKIHNLFAFFIGEIGVFKKYLNFLSLEPQGIQMISKMSIANFCSLFRLLFSIKNGIIEGILVCIQ